MQLRSVELPDGWSSKMIEVEDPDYGWLRESNIVISRFSAKTYDRVVRMLEKYTDIHRQLVSPSVTTIKVSFNKCLSYKQFVKAGIATPVTKIFLGKDYLVGSVGIPGPWVIKPASENCGNGVARVDSSKDLESISREYAARYGDHIIQSYAETGGLDRRLLVIGDRVVAAMERTAPAGDFRSNLSVGGTGSKYVPTVREVEIAVNAARCLGIDFAGVDILPTASGPLVLEVNSSPGFTIGKLHGIDIPALLVTYLITEYTRLYD